MSVVYCTTHNMESAMKTTGFGYFLRDTRENAKISLRRLAQETKLDPAYLSRLERELNPAPRQEVIERIAKALCDLENLPIAECEKLKRDLLDSAGQLTDDADLIDDLKQRFAERLREKGTPESYIADAVNKVSFEDMDSVLSGKESLEVLNAVDIETEEDAIEQDEVNKQYLLNQEISPKFKKYASFTENIEEIAKERAIKNRSSEKLKSFLEPSESEIKESASDYINTHYIRSKSISETLSSPSPRRRSRAVKKTKFRAGVRAFIEVDGDLTSNQEELLRSITNTVRLILKGK